jgi:hypothetical protein
LQQPDREPAEDQADGRIGLHRDQSGKHALEDLDACGPPDEHKNTDHDGSQAEALGEGSAD